MVFIPTAKPGKFQDEMIDTILANVNPFFLVRLRPPGERYGRPMQGVIIKRPPDLPDMAEVFFMPEWRLGA